MIFEYFKDQPLKYILEKFLLNLKENNILIAHLSKSYNAMTIKFFY